MQGVVGGYSEAGIKPNYLKRVDNILFEPHRAISSRPGYRAVTDTVVAESPTSLMRWYGVGSTQTFLAAGNKIYRIHGGTDYAVQTLPAGFSAGSGKWSHCNLNGLLICTQEGNTNVPLVYDGTTWMSSTLPTPGATFAVADGLVGNVDTGAHSWRIRWRFRNGASLASAKVDFTAAGSKKAELTAVPLSTRADYLGFSVERTKVGEPGVWYWVGDSSSATATTYSDNTADANLGDLIAAEPGPYGSAPHFDGVTAHADLLFGWAGTTLYASQPIGGDDASGPLNFHPYHAYPIKADDGDPIMAVAAQMDRLAVVKTMSTHVFMGYDPDSFSRVQLDDSVGCGSTRGVAAASGSVYLYGGHGRIFRIVGNSVQPFGDPQVTPYLDEIDPTLDSLVEVYNYRGDYILFCYPGKGSTYCNEILAYSLVHKNWTHFTNLRVSGALCPKTDSEFSGATMLFADPALHDPADVPPGESAPTTEKPFYLAWLDDRLKSAQYRQSFAQRVDTLGAPSWPADGEQVSNSLTLDAGACAICATTPSGCVVATVEEIAASTGNLVVRKYAADGVLSWSQPARSNSTYLLTNPAVVELLDGSIVVLWSRDTGGIVQGQKFNAAGVIQWAAAGKDVLSASLYTAQTPSFRACSDGLGGFWVVWLTGSPTQVKLAHFDASGTQIGSSTFANNDGRFQYYFNILSDGAGGVWIAWSAGSPTYLFCCHYDTAGAPLFSVLDVTGSVAPLSGTLNALGLVRDGLGGVFVAWPIYSSGYKLIGQQVTAAGAKGLGASPLTLCTTLVAPPNISGRLVRDSVGGFILAWTDAGDGVRRIKCQRYSSAGAPVWASPVSVEQEAVGDGINFDLEDLLPDGNDGAYVIYTAITGSTATTRNVRANRIHHDGALWASTGLVVCSAANAQVSPKAALEGVQYGDLPTPLVPGYKVWSAFVGELDACCFDGSLGDPIECYFEQPWWDAGEPDTVKLIDRVQFHTAEGSASFALTIETDEATVTLSLDVAQSGSTWGGGPAHLPSTLVWNQGKWGGRKAAVATTGVTPGVIGHRARVKGTCSATEKFVLEGWDIDAMILPERNYHQ
jgi:hypothetical protein